MLIFIVSTLVLYSHQQCKSFSYLVGGFLFVCFFSVIHYNLGEIKSLCSFDLHFLDGKKILSIFNVSCF